MKRCILCLVLGLLLIAPEIVLSQRFADGSGSPALSRLMSGGLPTPGAAIGQPGERFALGAMTFQPLIKAGFQHIDFRFNLPTVLPGSGEAAGLDLKFRNANVWTGALGLEAHCLGGLSAYILAEGAIPRNIALRTGEQPLTLSFPEGRQPLDWTGSRLEWWQIDGGLSYRVGESLSLLAGLKRDHLSVALNEPTDAAGNPVNFGFEETLAVFAIRYNQETLADFQTKLWVPYLGLKLYGSNFRASVMWSPFASVSTKIPIRAFNSAGVFILNVPFITADTAGEWGYSMFKPGTYLEGNFEYELNLNSAIAFQLWCKGSVLDIKGKGSLDYRDNAIFSLFGAPFDTSSITQTDEVSGHLSWSSLAAGLTASLNW